MNLVKHKFLFAISLLVFFANTNNIIAQQSTNNTCDSLSLKKIIEDVLKNYPSIKLAEEAINAADAKIGLAKSAYYPNVDGNASYTRLGPTSEMSIPHLGTFQLYPANNYNTDISCHQTIYDFGKTSKSIDVENQNKELAKMTVEQVKQKLTSTVINNFYTILYLQESIKIKDEQISTLKEHLNYVEKKMESGSATQYEILTTKVKISNVENQKTDLENSLSVQQTILNTLLGQSETSSHFVKKEINISITTLPFDSLIPHATKNRDEILIAQQKSAISELKYKMVKSQTNPVFGAFASGGVKNGYIPDLNKITPNFVAGLSFKIPIYDGTRTKYNLLLAKSSIDASNIEIEMAKRVITNEVIESEENVKTSLKKVSQSELQLHQAQQAFELAKTSFKSGVITNLELLDNSTSVSESSLMVLKSKIDYIISIYKLKIALGDRLY